MSNSTQYKRYISIAFSKSIIKRAIKIAFLVGTILNLINQGNALFTLHFELLNLTKIFLTYFVPYAVVTYTATATKLESL